MDGVLVALILFSIIGVIQALRQFAIRRREQKRTKEMIERFNETGTLPPTLNKKWQGNSKD